MHNNYHFIKHLAPSLDVKLKNALLIEVFSQNKDELILGFARDGKEFFIQADLSPSFSCLSFPDTFHRAKKNSVDLFDEVRNQAVSKTFCFQNNRAFYIAFRNDYKLVFKLFGNRSNIILFKEDRPLKVFKHSLKNDWELKLDEFDQYYEKNWLVFEKLGGDLKKFDPTLGKPVMEYLDQFGFSSKTLEERWEMIQNLYKALDQQIFYVLQDPTSLWCMPPEGDAEKFTGPLEAITHFYFQHTKRHHFEKNKYGLLQQLDQQQKSTKNYIQKTSNKLKALEHGVKYDQIADILMANLHRVKPNQKATRLYDFYHDEEIEIKLNPRLTPQKNAEQYYRKSKNQRIEWDKLRENIDRKRSLLKEIDERIEKIESTASFQELKPYVKTKSEQKQSPNTALPYWLFEKNGFEILVGKNAAKNDQLTFKVALKNDLWLHAKDTTGSHVVIRQRGNHYPEDIVEYAASLAAWHSKRKSESICPVSVAPRKYVRKPKGVPAGAVLVDKERVVLVPPEKP
mgnify:FL=1